jgi:hypothetical protein
MLFLKFNFCSKYYNGNYFKNISNPWNKDAKDTINEITQVYQIKR